MAHYPPYCSKWNPIEHRLFPHLTGACRGVIFHTLETVRYYMAKAKTKKGLKVKVSIFDKVYETGRKYAAGFKKTMKIVFDEFLPKWNYRAVPQSSVKSESCFRPVPKSLSGYLHPSHIHGRSICTGCLDSATMLVRPHSSGLMHHGGARICMVVVRELPRLGRPAVQPGAGCAARCGCPKTTWCSSCWISSRRSISRPSTSITPKSCAANRLST